MSMLYKSDMQLSVGALVRTRRIPNADPILKRRDMAIPGYSQPTQNRQFKLS
jgi:hypothetical protein